MGEVRAWHLGSKGSTIGWHAQAARCAAHTQPLACAIGCSARVDTLCATLLLDLAAAKHPTAAPTCNPMLPRPLLPPLAALGSSGSSRSSRSWNMHASTWLRACSAGIGCAASQSGPTPCSGPPESRRRILCGEGGQAPPHLLESPHACLPLEASAQGESAPHQARLLCLRHLASRTWMHWSPHINAGEMHCSHVNAGANKLWFGSISHGRTRFKAPAHLLCLRQLGLQKLSVRRNLRHLARRQPLFQHGQLTEANANLARHAHAFALHDAVGVCIHVLLWGCTLWGC